MLTDNERLALLDKISHYPEARAGAILVLQTLQNKYGHLDGSALREASDLCGLSVTQLDELVSFYPLLFRHPVGKQVLRICDSIACHMAGSSSLLEEAERLAGVPLGEVSPDGRFTVLPNVCLGLCNRAPAVLLDDDALGPVDMEQLATLIQGPSR